MSFKYRERCLQRQVNAYSQYDILLSPVATEKSMNALQYNQYTFKVRLDATKPAIKQAVEGIFGVKVTAVNTSILPGKQKRFRQRLGQRSDVKKAVVTLAQGQTIDTTAGV
ncbi:MAG: 50S ribosomal protein L23 [Holosporales bacterium]|jgi:large subunit ribosomal protein L23